MIRQHRWLAPGILTMALALASAGAVLIAARAASGSATDASTLAPVPMPTAPAAPMASSGRLVCSFSNDDADAALIQGADGGASIVAGGRSWWFFGDTLFLAQSGKQIEANA
ncbi:MAG: hypothetical protein EPO22_13965, partial [Dehalococcoidia bacterium]